MKVVLVGLLLHALRTSHALRGASSNTVAEDEVFDVSQQRRLQGQNQKDKNDDKDGGGGLNCTDYKTNLPSSEWFQCEFYQAGKCNDASVVWQQSAAADPTLQLGLGSIYTFFTGNGGYDAFYAACGPGGTCMSGAGLTPAADVTDIQAQGGCCRYSTTEGIKNAEAGYVCDVTVPPENPAGLCVCNEYTAIVDAAPTPAPKGPLPPPPASSCAGKDPATNEWVGMYAMMGQTVESCTTSAECPSYNTDGDSCCIANTCICTTEAMGTPGNTECV